MYYLINNCIRVHITKSITHWTDARLPRYETQFPHTPRRRCSVLDFGELCLGNGLQISDYGCKRVDREDYPVNTKYN